MEFPCFRATLGTLVTFVREQSKVFIALYANDIIIAYSNILILQQVVNDVIQWLSAKGLDVTTKKTRAMKFRRGGGIARTEFAWFMAHWQGT